MLPLKLRAASWRAVRRVSTLLDRQAGAPGQASILSIGSSEIDDEAKSAGGFDDRTRSRAVTRLGIEGAPGRQSNVCGTTVAHDIDQAAQLRGFETAEGRGKSHSDFS